MVFAFALSAVAVRLGIVAVYGPAGAALALGMPDVVIVAVALELDAESVVSAVQPLLCTTVAELQVSAEVGPVFV